MKVLLRENSDCGALSKISQPEFVHAPVFQTAAPVTLLSL